MFGRGCQGGPLLQHVRPKFCSMKITQDVRDYAAKQTEIEAGMAEKSVEFAGGGDVRGHGGSG